MRDIECKIGTDEQLQSVFADELGLAKHLLTQEKNCSDKLYSLHTPEVELHQQGQNTQTLRVRGQDEHCGD